MINDRTRYLQLAFNDDLAMAAKLVPTLPKDPRLILEAGTPFLKREGMSGVRALRALWPYNVLADLKTVDGAFGEVAMAAGAGASMATVLGSCPAETLNLFIQACAQYGVDSFVDLIGLADPLGVLRKLRQPPRGVVLHLGRDEESTRGKTIQYQHVNRILSKFDVAIAAAGGVDLKGASSAVFNGASVVVVNVVPPGMPWAGIPSTGDVAGTARQFLATIA
jgi:3-keto-L-gulonate-6-phosphate decarboxylase